jgi:hypothetical protein
MKDNNPMSLAFSRRKICEIRGLHGGEVLDVFVVVTPCGLVGRYHSFEETYCLY